MPMFSASAVGSALAAFIVLTPTGIGAWNSAQYRARAAPPGALRLPNSDLDVP